MPDPLDRVSVDEAQQPLFVGVDVGGTSIKIGCVDDLGRTLAFKKTSTHEERGPQDAVERIAAAVANMLSGISLAADEITAVGLGTPGSMDIPAGVILEPPNMPHWRDFPIRDRLSERCGRPVAFANDANAAAYGEYWVGSGRDFASMVMLTLGTGVGGGIIIDGKSIDGEHSFGSECGHIIIDSRDDARLCVWGGGQGQLEAYASAPAVVARTEEALAGGEPSSLSARIASGELLTPLMLAEEAEAGDKLSREIIFETAKFLSIGVVTLVHTVDPGAVIFGGAMNLVVTRPKLAECFCSECERVFATEPTTSSWTARRSTTRCWEAMPGTSALPESRARRITRPKPR